MLIITVLICICVEKNSDRYAVVYFSRLPVATLVPRLLFGRLVSSRQDELRDKRDAEPDEVARVVGKDVEAKRGAAVLSEAAPVAAAKHAVGASFANMIGIR